MDILYHRQVSKDPRYLKRSSDAEVEDPVRRQLRYLVIPEDYRSAIGMLVTSHDIEECGLARSVWTNQTIDLALFKCHRAAVEGPNATVRLVDIVDFQQTHWFTSLATAATCNGSGEFAAPSFDGPPATTLRCFRQITKRRHISVTVGTMPDGNNLKIRMKTMP